MARAQKRRTLHEPPWDPTNFTRDPMGPHAVRLHGASRSDPMGLRGTQGTPWGPTMCGRAAAYVEERVQLGALRMDLCVNKSRSKELWVSSSSRSGGGR